MPPEKAPGENHVSQTESQMLSQRILDQILHYMFGVGNPLTPDEISSMIQNQVGEILLKTTEVDETMNYLADVDGFIQSFYKKPDTEGATVFLGGIEQRTNALLKTIHSQGVNQVSKMTHIRTSRATKEGNSDTVSPTKTKKLSRLAQEPFIPQTREELFENSHLNNRHPIQRQILEKILVDISDKGKTTGYIHEPARIGKTAIYIDFIRHYFHYLCDELNLGKRVFILVPSVELVRQMPDEIEKFFPQVSIGVYYGLEKNIAADVVVLTYTSFNKLVEKDLIKSENRECIILDEAHESLSDLRQDLIGRFTAGIRIGGTATSELGDERTVESLLHHEYHRMSIVQAIGYELIAPYWVIYVLTQTDLSGVKMVRGDFSDSQLSAKINNKTRNDLVVQLYKQCFAGKKAIAYCGVIDHSHSLRDEFNMAGVKAISIDSSLGYDDVETQAFRDNKYQVATNPFKLVQGFDDPEVEVIFAVRPSFSPRIVGQSRPRGQTLREGKACSYIVELIDPSADRFPLLYEEFVLSDHRKTTGDEDFSLEDLRDIMSKKIHEKGELISMPDEINGSKIASDIESTKQLFQLRKNASHEDLIRRGITPGDPPDDHASFTEFEIFANMTKGWVTKNMFRIANRKGFKYFTTIQRYKVGTQRVKEYIPPHIFSLIFEAYEMKYLSWERPLRDFSRKSFMTESFLKRKTGDTQVYSFSMRELAEKVRCDISFLEEYASDFFVKNEVLFSFTSYTYDGSLDMAELIQLIEEKKQQEISINEIAQFIRMDPTTVAGQLFEIFNERNMPLLRLDKGYILLDHWLLVESEMNS